MTRRLNHNSAAAGSGRVPCGEPKIALFGHFGRDNFGNESTLRAILHYLRCVAPDAHFNCICTGPEAVTAMDNVAAVNSRAVLFKPWASHNPFAKLARRLFIGIPSEIYRWLESLHTLRGTDALIVPGTGLLTDAYTLVGWGPYEMFRWSVAAKLCRCKVLFVSVGAGPLYSRAGRFFVKAALSLADFRSYRDESSKRYLKSIGFRADNDPVYPDLVFSLPSNLLPRDRDAAGRRLVVGLGLMDYAGRYSAERPNKAVYAAYLETLVEFVAWALSRNMDIRLLIGDVVDNPAKKEFHSLLKERGVAPEQGRIIDDPITSVEDLLSQLAATDLVVATRFHNVLLSLVLRKPVIAISFHHKCSSLMSQMGLSEYCQDINSLRSESLIRQFCELQKNEDCLRLAIHDKVEGCRAALHEQYRALLRSLQLDDVSTEHANALSSSS
jgi:polysaccharide pyruvyl transferase WcaK-like protein